MSGFAKIQLRADVLEKRVVVNGDDISHQLRGAVLDLGGRDELARLTVEFTNPAAEFEGEGVVHVIAGDVRAEFIELLEGLDPKAVEERALQMSGWGSSPAQSMLEAIIETVRGVT